MAATREAAPGPRSARRRFTRQEQQARTRALLLDTAVDVCAERGLAGARVEEICERAGFSTGAVYSNFAGKDDLLLAVFEERLEPRLRKLAAPLIAAETAAEQAQASGALIRSLLADERPYLVLLGEFWARAARDPDVGERFAAIRRRRRTMVQGMIEERVSQGRAAAGLPAADLAAGFVGLAMGVLFESLVDRELDGERVYRLAFELMSAGAARAADTPTTARPRSR
jgi:AcrR family transcriptional regulator